MSKPVLFVFLPLLACAAMPAPADDGFVTEYGVPTVREGFEIRTFASHNGNEIKTFGVEIPVALLASMAPSPSDGQNDIPVSADDPAQGVAWYCCGHEITLALPEAVTRLSAFRTVVLNWNPMGHVPPGVFDSAHIDFHFYFMDNDERLAIGHARDASEMCPFVNLFGAGPPELLNPLNCEQLATAAAPVPDDQMPAGYTNVFATEPGMGNHLLDLAAHEFHGQSFTHTFIYMANAGRLTGMEPMITQAWLRGLEAPMRVAISMPAAFPQAGNYPTEYVMEYDRGAEAFRVWYENWKPFPASNGLRTAPATAMAAHPGAPGQQQP